MPKRFVFRYEILLKIRRQHEDRHKQIVAERVGQITAARDRLAALNHQIAAEEGAIRTGQGTGTIDMQQLIRHRHWLGHLHKTALETQSSIRSLEARLAQERAALAEAVKQRKILDQLKERRLERHVHEQDRRETSAVDDLNTIRFVHRAPEALDVGAER